MPESPSGRIESFARASKTDSEVAVDFYPPYNIHRTMPSVAPD